MQEGRWAVVQAGKHGRMILAVRMRDGQGVGGRGCCGCVYGVRGRCFAAVSMTGLWPSALIALSASMRTVVNLM